MIRVLLKITCCALLLLLLAACKPATYENACAAGDKYLAVGKYDKALEAYSQAIELNELGIEAYIGIGEANAALGADTASVEAQYEKAIDIFRKAPMTDMENVIGTYNRIVDDFWNLGNIERAFQLVEEKESVVGAGTEMSNEELSAFHQTQYALLVKILAERATNGNTAAYLVNDMDDDGRLELAMEGFYSESQKRKSQLIADADSCILYGFTASGAAGTCSFEYSNSENKVVLVDGYYSTASGFTSHSFWNQSGWEQTLRRDHHIYDADTDIQFDYSYQNAFIDEAEYESRVDELDLAEELPQAKPTEIFNVGLDGEPLELLYDYDQYLSQRVEGYFARGVSDVDDDGELEIVFFIQNAPEYWWDNFIDGGSLGDERWHNAWRFPLSVVIGNVTKDGITLSTTNLHNLNNGGGEFSGTTPVKAENVEIVDGKALLKLNGVYYELKLFGEALLNSTWLSFKPLIDNSGKGDNDDEKSFKAIEAYSAVTQSRQSEYGIAYSTGDTGLMYGELVHLDEDDVPELYLATCTSVVEDPWSGYFYTIKEEIWSFDNAQGVRQCWEDTYYCGGDAGLEWSAFVSNEGRTYFATYSYGSGSQWYGLVVRHGTVYECADGQMQQIFDAEARDITIEADHSWDAFVNDYNYEGQTPEQGYSYSLVTKDDRDVYVSQFAKITENGTTKIVDWDSFDTYLAPWALSENDTVGRRQLCKSAFDSSSVFYQSFNADEFIDSLSAKLNNG